MKILLNVSVLRSPLGGIGHYTRYLAKGLARWPGVEDLIFYDRFRLSRSLPPLAAQPTNPLKHPILNLPFTRAAYSAANEFIFRCRSRSLSSCIYHETNLAVMPFSGVSVATIHDLSYLHYPQFHPRHRVKEIQRRMRRTLVQAAHLITDSEYVKAELVGLLGAPLNKITVIPLAADRVFYPRDEIACRAILQRHGLEYKKFLLAVGTLEPRKNIARLIEAFLQLPTYTRESHPLVLVGIQGWLEGPLVRLIGSLVRTGQVRYLGYVSSSDLPFIYAGASAFAFPSLYEGFGLPILEAMASGLPILASNRASIPEVAGDMSLLVDPEDIDGMKDGLAQILRDETFRNVAKIAGPARAAGFTWEKCVENTIKVYRRALGAP